MADSVEPSTRGLRNLSVSMAAVRVITFEDSLQQPVPSWLPGPPKFSSLARKSLLCTAVPCCASMPLSFPSASATGSVTSVVEGQQGQHDFACERLSLEISRKGMSPTG